MLLAALLTLSGPAAAADPSAEPPPAQSGRVVSFYGRVVYRTGTRWIRHANGEVAMDTRDGQCFAPTGAEVPGSACDVTLIDGTTMTFIVDPELGVILRGMQAAELPPLRPLQGPKVASTP